MLDSDELNKVGTNVNNWMWMGVVLVHAYLFVRVSKTNKQYGYAIMWWMLWRMFCAPGERTFSRVKVPKSSGSGKNSAKGKGVRREAESEGSRIYISSRLLL